ncbi:MULTISPECIES: DeoR/GlpR family DNA-binding transcription regulator [unclassified Streptococcus]|uniref:DeoR/GlpR family DNA-binding transcription regulator n=1 Tax=unclassified Streptococcus TaxID=2608887 RepID=UPI0010727FBE|nr:MULTISPECIES: DeoR/GlpR family DNA-binding transcription regulator [unclassified Streptococcus]MBF0787316.1 DeoR/GlpR transcriptional regulator [Streptococcus sp. 19428wC2_LYSM12]MCQ9212655.1 DeoR/GlpR family DNA-binding transcription regulator [Streptococcus sp. B01]MCQ9213994.1 DeoR/GlpR family DNA-binding transcription regulator [Streptococcus sp. O1]TFV05802.1 DeoR/GlpR transcriptional regulator [Streptococcus sp. LYSM12]
MNQTERIRNITKIISNKRRISIKELSQKTFYSTSTLRRDLIFLENQGYITRKHGEVILNSFNTKEMSHYIRESENRVSKRTIASLAKQFVKSGMCIFLDASTTVYELCPYLCEIENLIVFTNGLNTAQKLSEFANPSMKIFITGGEIKHYSSSVINLDIEHSLINHFNIDLAICSATGIDDHFVYEASLSQAMSKKRVMDKATETLLLIDSSKFYHTGFFKINSINHYKAIISDKFPPTNLLKNCEDQGVDWISK